MKIYAYVPVQDAWTVHHMLTPRGSVQHGQHQGVSYVGVPADAVIAAEHPAGIAPAPVQMTPQMLALLTTISPQAQYVKRQQAERMASGEAQSAAQAWADTQMAALGLVLPPQSPVPQRLLCCDTARLASAKMYTNTPPTSGPGESAVCHVGGFSLESRG